MQIETVAVAELKTDENLLKTNENRLKTNENLPYKSSQAFNRALPIEGKPEGELTTGMSRLPMKFY